MSAIERTGSLSNIVTLDMLPAREVAPDLRPTGPNHIVTLDMLKPTVPLVLHLRPEARDPGHALDNSGLPAAKPQSAEKESLLRDRIAAVRQWGRVMDIRTLFTQMESAPLSDADRAEFNKWAPLICRRIEPGSSDVQQLAIAILFARVILPAASRNSNLQNQAQQWGQLSLNILRKLLPAGEKPEDFLKDCSLGLMEQRLLERQEDREALVEQVEHSVLESINRSLHAQFEQNCASIREAARNLAESQREDLEAIERRREELAQGVERVRQLIAGQTQRLQQLENPAERERFAAILAECEAQMGRLS